MFITANSWQEVAPTVRAVLSHFVKKAELEAAAPEPAINTSRGLPVLRELTDVLGWRAGPINANWGGPRPLTNTLIGAGLGALLGTGVGTVAEWLAPEDTFNENALKRRGALLGAALGAVPGLYQTFDNAMAGYGPWSSWPQPYPPPPPTPEQLGAVGGGAMIPINWHKDNLGQFKSNKSSAALSQAVVQVYKLAAEQVKRAEAPLWPFAPIIPVDPMQRMIMMDPMTPMNIRAGASGLLEAASTVRGSPLVSPSDIARIAIHCGAGRMVGNWTGRMLGVLAGLTPNAQKRLQDAGEWAGMLRAVIPSALGFGTGD
jgi:hypothetical protein